MADQKLSQLPPGGPVTPTDLFYSADDLGGGSFTQVKQTASALQTFVNGIQSANITYYISNLSGTITAKGAGYVPGTYLNVALNTTGGPGSGATADVIVTLVGSITNGGSGVGGTGYVAGIYTNVPLTGSATGSGASADITVGTIGNNANTGTAVTSVRLRPTGTSAYLSGDVLVANNATLGGGVGFQFTLSANGGGVTTVRPRNTGSGFTNASTLGVTTSAIGGGSPSTLFAFAVSAMGSNANNGLTPTTPWRTLQFATDQVARLDLNYDFALTLQLASGVYDGVYLKNMPQSTYAGGFVIQGDVANSDPTQVHILSTSAGQPIFFGPCSILQTMRTEFFFLQFLTFNVVGEGQVGVYITGDPSGFTQLHHCNFTTTGSVIPYSCMIIGGDGGQCDLTHTIVDGGTWGQFMELTGASSNYFLESFTFLNNPIFNGGVWYLTNVGFVELGVPTRNPPISFFGTCTGARFRLAFDSTLIYNNAGVPNQLPGTRGAVIRDSGTYDGMALMRNGLLSPPRLVSQLPTMPDQFFAGTRLTVANALYGSSGSAVVGTPGTVVTISEATPAVVSWANHGLSAGDRVVFTSAGLLPRPMGQVNTNAPDVLYYVLASGLTSSQFQIGIAPGGTAISTAPLSISTATWAATAGGQATFTTTAPHGLTVPAFVNITGVSLSGYNTQYTVISIPTTTTFVVALVANPGGAGSGGTATSQTGVHSAYAGNITTVYSDGVTWRLKNDLPLVAATTFYVANYSGTLTGGSGYTSGTFTNVAFTNVSGSGTGAAADFVVTWAGTVTTAGVGYTNGTYYGVPLTTSGTGTGGTANIVIAGGAVSSFTPLPTGSGYKNADTVSASAANLGGGSPSTLFVFTINAVSVTVCRPTATLGTGYVIGNVLSAAAANIGGTVGTAFNFTITGIGSDANSGTLGLPWLTLQKAADFLTTLDFGGQQVTIQVQNGTYSGVNFYGPYEGQGVLPVLVKGNLATPTAVAVNGVSRNALGFNGAAYWEISGFSVSATGNDSILGTPASGVAAVGFADVGTNNKIVGAMDYRAATVQLYCANGILTMGGTDTVNGNANSFIECYADGTVYHAVSSSTFYGARTYTSGVLNCANGYIELDTAPFNVGGSVTGNQAVITDAGVIQSYISAAAVLPGSLPIQYNDNISSYINNNFQSSFQDPAWNRQNLANATNYPMNNLDWHLVITPQTSFTTLTVTMPPAPVDGQMISIRTSAAVSSTFTLAAPGKTIAGYTAGALAAGQLLDGYYIAADNTWYFASGGSGGGTTSPFIQAVTAGFGAI